MSVMGDPGWKNTALPSPSDDILSEIVAFLKGKKATAQREKQVHEDKLREIKEKRKQLDADLSEQNSRKDELKKEMRDIDDEIQRTRNEMQGADEDSAAEQEMIKAANKTIEEADNRVEILMDFCAKGESLEPFAKLLEYDGFIHCKRTGENFVDAQYNESRITEDNGGINNE